MVRRYDIDWIRVVAIGLLLIYHAAIGFQPWGFFIGFITNNEPLEWLWLPMTMLNVWRIPILFYISGMGFFMAMQNKNWKQLLIERFKRILIPLLFGAFAIVPIHIFFLQNYYGSKLTYLPSIGHLWFLGNILLYILILIPVLYPLKKQSNYKVVNWIKKIFSSPLGFWAIIILFVIEVIVLKPNTYEMYAFTSHGFFLGLLAFLFGYLFMLSGDPFWQMLVKWKWLFLSIAILLFILRSMQLNTSVKNYLLVIESTTWILSIFAFAYQYLNKSSKQLTYLKEAAYPIYIVHMTFLYLGSSVLFKTTLAVEVKYILLLLFTFMFSFAFYEFVLKRLNFMRVAFGLKNKEAK